MTPELLRQQLGALRHVVTSVANTGRTEDYSFAAHQSLLLDLLTTAQNAGIPRTEALTQALSCIHVLLDVVERDRLPLSNEFGSVIAEAKAVGLRVREPVDTLPTQALESFPTSPPVVHTLFVDEAGTPAFDERSQPVLSLVGVLAADREVSSLNTRTEALLLQYGIPPSTEIHASPCIKGEDTFGTIADAGRRYELLRDFAALGLAHATGVHYMSMLKPFVKVDVRQQFKQLRLDAYTTMVIWFNVTVQVGATPLVGTRKYRYLYDRNDAYRKKVTRIIRALKASANERLRLSAVEGDPQPVDSANHRFVQLADTLGFFLTRYRQFEVRTFTPSPNLLKYEPQVREVYEIVKPRLMDFVNDGRYMLIDWKALQTWSPF